jgi:hypothetical protein
MWNLCVGVVAEAIATQRGKDRAQKDRREPLSFLGGAVIAQRAQGNLRVYPLRKSSGSLAMFAAMLRLIFVEP